MDGIFSMADATDMIPTLSSTSKASQQSIRTFYLQQWNLLFVVLFCVFPLASPLVSDIGSKIIWDGMVIATEDTEEGETIVYNGVALLIVQHEECSNIIFVKFQGWQSK